MAQIVDLTEQTFESQAGSGVVLVDFWAPWCGPCRLQHPILDEVCGQLGDQARVARVNVEENPQLAERFGIQGIPTLVVLKHGKEVSRMVGVTDELTLRQAVTRALS